MLQHQESQEQQRKIPLATVFIGAVVLAAIGASLWFLFQPVKPQPAVIAVGAAIAKMSPAEEAYSPSVHIENIALSRAENFLHQEVTILNADAVNTGSSPVGMLSVTVEFLDDMNQIVLRETRGVLGAPPTDLKPGERRAFEISFDRVPPSWNYQQPKVRVSYLQLSSQK